MTPTPLDLTPRIQATNRVHMNALISNIHKMDAVIANWHETIERNKINDAREKALRDAIDAAARAGHGRKG